MDRKNRFAEAESYVVYYGRERVEVLNKFDIAIVEPAGYNEAEIKKIQNTGTLVLAYISIVEIPPWSDILRYLDKEDFLSVAGEKVFNEEYGNYCANLRSAKWQGILINKVSELLEYKNYDGLFLDTIGFLESQQIPAKIRQVQIDTAREILQKIRFVFPEHILVQNCGLFEVVQSTYPFIDGICWENPPLELQEKWLTMIVEKLLLLKLQHGLEVFILLENIQKENLRYIKAHELAEQKKFRIYDALNSYTGEIIINNGSSFP